MLSEPELKNAEEWKAMIVRLIAICEKARFHHTMELAKALLLYADRQITVAQRTDITPIARSMARERARRQARVVESYRRESWGLRCP